MLVVLTMKMYYCRNGYTGEEAVVVALSEEDVRHILDWNDMIITDTKDIKAIIIGKKDPSRESKTSDKQEMLI